MSDSLTFCTSGEGEGSPVWTDFFQLLPDCYASVGAADTDSEFGDGHDVSQVLSDVSLGRGSAVPAHGLAMTEALILLFNGNIYKPS